MQMQSVTGVSAPPPSAQSFAQQAPDLIFFERPLHFPFAFSQILNQRRALNNIAAAKPSS
jgi:hypothetical protein